MRLRKNFKRTAAAALALGMTVSTAAIPASATTYIKVTKDSTLTITKDDSGVTYEGDNYVKKDVDDGKTDIVLTSSDSVMPKSETSQSMDDAPQSDENKAATLAASAEDAAPVVDENELTYGDTKDTEDTDKAEETTEDSEGTTEEDSEDTPAPTDGIATMDLPGEDEPEGTVEEGQPERTVTETELGTVIEYGDYTVDPDVQVSQPAPKAEKDDEKEYTNSNAVTKFTDSMAQAAESARNFVIKIINKVSGADNALNVTLDNVNIDVSDTGDGDNDTAGNAALSVEGSGDVNLELDGQTTLTSGLYRAGLEKNDSTSTGTLTIKDDDNNGSLTVTGGGYGAGIGGAGNMFGNAESTGNITITGGTITATGRCSGAGIGGGGAANGKAGNGNVSITDGTINASSNGHGAGIGGGGTNNGTTGTGTVTITGGIINASSTDNGAGIGGGGSYDSMGGIGTVTITNSTITNASSKGYGAGIGGGGSEYRRGGVGTVTIINSTVTNASSNYQGAGIGGGGGASFGGAGNVTITGSTITNASGAKRGAGIGGGGAENATGCGAVGNVKIESSTVETAKSGGADCGGAGIGNGGTKNDSGFPGTTDADGNVNYGSVEIIDSTIGKYEENGNLVAGTGAIGGSGAKGVGDGAGTNPNKAPTVSIDESSVVASAIQGHTHTPGEMEIIEPTCTTDGQKVQRCTSDECNHSVLSYEVIPATGVHTWSNWEPVPGEPTLEYRTCTVCGAKESQTVELNGGSDGATAETPAAEAPIAAGSVPGLTLSGALGGAQNYTTTRQEGGLTVTTLHVFSTLRCTIGTLRQLKAQGVEYISLHTALRTSTVAIDDLLALGAEDAAEVVLAHKGTVATLTVGGVQHNELIH